MKRRRRKKHTPDQMEQQRRGRKVFRVLGRVLLTGIGGCRGGDDRVLQG